MAFKRSAVQSRLSPPRPTERLVFFFCLESLSGKQTTAVRSRLSPPIPTERLEFFFILRVFQANKTGNAPEFLIPGHFFASSATLGLAEVSLPVAVIGFEHAVIVGVAAVGVGAFEDRGFQTSLHQIVHHLADQGLGDGDAGEAGGGADGGVQALDGEGGVARLAPVVDGHVGDLIHFLAGAVARGAAFRVLHARHGDDLRALCLCRQAHLHGDRVPAGVGDDQDRIPGFQAVQLHDGLGIALHALQVGAFVGHLVDHQLRRQDGMDQGQATGPEVKLLGDHMGMAGAEDIEFAALCTALSHQICRGLNIGHLMLQHLLKLLLCMVKKTCCRFHCSYLLMVFLCKKDGFPGSRPT